MNRKARAAYWHAHAAYCRAAAEMYRRQAEAHRLDTLMSDESRDRHVAGADIRVADYTRMAADSEKWAREMEAAA